MHDWTHLTAGNRTSSSEAAWKVHTARRNLWRSTRPRSCEALASRLCWSLDACSETSCGSVKDTSTRGSSYMKSGVAAQRRLQCTGRP